MIQATCKIIMFCSATKWIALPSATLCKRYAHIPIAAWACYSYISYSNEFRYAVAFHKTGGGCISNEGCDCIFVRKLLTYPFLWRHGVCKIWLTAYCVRPVAFQNRAVWKHLVTKYLKPAFYIHLLFVLPFVWIVRDLCRGYVKLGSQY